ncbi:thiamine-phosphate kinase [Salipaludibacillus sp. CF4.18]|uniref:thiamine-phosphate kinase n=1 Tax=Salipaludibacillus sp. CF4.18 TaxID=3373081 RepID=UPI003EE76F6D
MNNEFDWIKSVTPTKTYHSSVKVGIGDDAAIYSHGPNEESVVAVDTMVEGVHFRKDTMPIKSIGYKVLAVNLSDMAAMGASPRYFLVSIAIPKQGWSLEETTEIYAGMNELAERWQIDLIGGDTVSTKGPLVITVTVIGSVITGKRLLRSNAKPADIVFTTGQLGLSAYGLEMLLETGLKVMEDISLRPFMKAHQKPEPQLEAGGLLADSGYRISLNDISDGIAHEAKEIAGASDVDIIIDWDKLVIREEFLEHSLEKQEEWVLYSGEDFHLVGTMSEADFEKISIVFKEHDLQIHAIGNVETGEGRVFLERRGNRSPIKKAGYHHF